MNGFKQTLLSRGMVLAQILLILGGILVGYMLPQRFTATQEELDQWQQAYPFWSPWVERLGLDHVYTTPWFAAFLLLFLFTLILSTFEQAKHSYRTTFGPGTPSDEKGLRISVPRERLRGAMKRAGYFQTYQDESTCRFIKNRWGHWGNVLLHCGIVVVIGASLALVITETRGLLHLLVGETHFPGDPWIVEETGMLSESFILPEAVRLDEVTPEYWETDDVKQLSTVFSFIDGEGKSKQYTLGINRTVDDKGLRIYQGRRYGDAFYIELTDGQGEKKHTILQIEHPRTRDLASYGNFFVDGVPYQIKAKYFADAEKDSIRTSNPLLVMRLMDKEKVLGEVSLKMGEEGKLGPYIAELVHVSPWSGIIFVRSTGMSGIFLGFIVIAVGVSLTYFMPPREFVVRKSEDDFLITWGASRFEKLYEDEYNQILSAIGG